MPSTPRLLSAVAVTVLLASGCGATVATEPDTTAPGYPVTVTNCGSEVTYDAKPTSVVSNDIGITELLFALGLEDHLAGYTLSEGQDSGVDSSPWRSSFEKVPRLAEKISTEVVQAAGADLVFAGWSYGFGDERGITPESLRRQGIDSYVLTESCRNGNESARGIMPPLEALYTDLRNLGKIFGVSERAERLIAEYKQTVAKASATVPDDKERPSVFLYDAGTDQPLTSGRNAGPHEIISKAGGENIFADLDDSWTTVSWETVVARDPDVILINDYAGGTPITLTEKKEFLRSNPALSSVTAVEQDRFFALPYAALVEGPRNPRAIADFAEYLSTIH
ncbi:iron complex transport system substrate-binding protein [Tamaricihabitans halophyticus]|uniref:Iron complex transport system substrate-binding protein n=1 Tax=Tamaricihabitans halophyticus TaxID=1262583 RepID=A0A4R2QV90_9PSEU|nr:ABC transporter substrate-binding protein [Tamaricihabitans halophyticus]TCP53647.1 iron complex transport system substrate-binding protein [Tamaricihabitans halophyticus]